MGMAALGKRRKQSAMTKAESVARIVIEGSRSQKIAFALKPSHTDAAAMSNAMVRAPSDPDLSLGIQN
jgi:hypothetical protein